MTEKKLFVVMPAYNAADTIEGVIRNLSEEAIAGINHFVVVNDGSKDETKKVVQDRLKNKYPITLLTHNENKGYGAAQKTGFKQAIKQGAEVIALLHSDGQYAPEVLLDMIKPIENGRADVVGGSRFKGGEMRRNMPPIRYFGNRTLTALENLIFGAHLSIYHSGYKVYSRKALKDIPFERYSDKFVFDSEMLFGALERNLTIEEVPIPTKYGEEETYLRSIPYGLRILKAIMKHKIYH